MLGFNDTSKENQLRHGRNYSLFTWFEIRDLNIKQAKKFDNIFIIDVENVLHQAGYRGTRMKEIDIV